MMISLYRLLPVAALCATALPAQAAGDPEAGRALYQTRCAVCHSLDFNGIGPAHRSVVGRAAGAVPGYSYSPALKGAGLVWNDANLDRWLADPERVAPGQRMGVSVPDARERSDLIAYLKSVAGAAR